MRSRNENDHEDEELFARAADGRLDGVPDGVVRRAASLRDARGATPLHVAAGDGAVAACRRLCAADPAAAAVRTTGRNGRTALHWAARNGRADACRFLVAEAGVPVDVPARGGVTPFQLAVWRGRSATARALVEELGADETSVNDWGCSASHWLGRADVDDDETLRGLCEWLWGTRGADARAPNHHGQTPLHKAAYAGNAAVYEYLVARAGVVDDRRDAAGNTAADCAERGRRPVAARWLRRHASVPVAEARRALGLDAARAPDAKTTREAYLRVARALRPGVDHADLGRWHRASDAYRLLTLWYDAPDELDAVVRVRSRNAALSERPRLAYTAEWHRANDDDLRSPNRDDDDDDDDDAHVNNEKDRLLDDRLATFERRLVRLLSTDAHRDVGLPISQLPREYTKSFGGSFFPNPKDYGCRKLVLLLERRCPLLAVERVYEDIAPVAPREKVVDGWTPPTRICTVRVRVASSSSSSSS